MSAQRLAGEKEAAARAEVCGHCGTSWISCRALGRHRHSPCCPTCTHYEDQP